MWKHAACLFIVTAGVVARGANAATPIYSVTDLGTFASTRDSYSIGVAINDSGQVTGYSGLEILLHMGNPEVAQPHAFLYDKVRMIDLGTFGATNSLGTAISNSGEVLIDATDTDNNVRRTIIYKNGSTMDIGSFGNDHLYIFGGINNAGQVTGQLPTPETGDANAFLYRKGTLIDLGTLGGTMSFGRAINDAGRIVGWSLTLNDELAHAFFYEKGVMTDIGSFGDADSYGTAINNGGQIVGYFTKDNATYGFLYDKGVVRGFGSLGDATYPYAINNSGQIVGRVQGQAFTHAFVYTNGTMLDLNLLIDPSLALGLFEARDINDRGWILANGAPRTSGEEPHAYLLIPKVGGALRVGSTAQFH